MTIDPNRLLDWKFPEIVQTYTIRDTILYALGLGIGANPLDPNQLRYVYEAGLKTLPSMGVVLASPGFWLKDPATGVDWKQLLHGEQGIDVFRPLPPAATVIGRTRVTGLVDKGPGKGALLYTERDVIDAADHLPLCRLRSTTFLRADGGFGTPARSKPPHQIPDRTPDHTVTHPTTRQAALIYRLSGDDNPLHADPAIARAAHFPRPILHGLCTFGIAAYALAQAVGGVASVDARFTAPVYPGETIVTHIWSDLGSTLSFRSTVQERDLVVLDNGQATFSSIPLEAV